MIKVWQYNNNKNKNNNNNNKVILKTASAILARGQKNVFYEPKVSSSPPKLSGYLFFLHWKKGLNAVWWSIKIWKAWGTTLHNKQTLCFLKHYANCNQPLIWLPPGAQLWSHIFFWEWLHFWQYTMEISTRKKTLQCWWNHQVILKAFYVVSKS